MDKASKVLENLAAPQPQLHVGYHRLSSNPLLVGKEIDLDSSLAHPALLKRDSLVSAPNQPLVRKSVNLATPSTDHYILKESGDYIAHVLLISSDSHESKSDPPVPVVQESPYPIPAKNGGNHMIPPPSSSIISFDWGPLAALCLPSYVPFQIAGQAYNMVVHGTILDEGTSISIMSSTTWQDFGSPQLVPITHNLWPFNRGTS